MEVDDVVDRERGAGGQRAPGSSTSGSVSASNRSDVPEAPRPATSTPAETSRATILRSARFSTDSMQVGHSKR